jgi:uncharacterized protein (DUF169 family)
MGPASHARSLTDLLALDHAPIAIAFVAAAPDGVPHASAAAPASCSYWARAAAGEVFFTDAADHQGCPVGAHIHGVPMKPETAAELGQLVQIMVKLDYLAEAEVPAIPTRKGPFGAAVYAPLARAPLPPDVVVVRGNARQIMLLAEAARAAGADAEAAVMGRPACAMLPQAMASARGQMSLGCIGNRVYTGLADEEMYYALPGAKLGRVVERLGAIAAANRELEQLHAARRDRVSR